MRNTSELILSKDDARRLAYAVLNRSYGPTGQVILAALEAKDEPVAWTRTDVPSPVIKEEVMLKHPELRQYYPTPLYYAPQEWYIVEKWVAGEKRSHIRRGESLDAVYNEEVAAGVDVINVITV